MVTDRPWPCQALHVNHTNAGRCRGQANGRNAARALRQVARGSAVSPRMRSVSGQVAMVRTPGTEPSSGLTRGSRVPSGITSPQGLTLGSWLGLLAPSDAVAFDGLLCYTAADFAGRMGDEILWCPDSSRLSRQPIYSRRIPERCAGWRGRAEFPLQRSAASGGSMKICCASGSGNEASVLWHNQAQRGRARQQDHLVAARQSEERGNEP